MPRKIIIDTHDYNNLYFRKLTNLFQAANNRVEYTEFRNKILRHQKGKNYQMESDRINGILESSTLHHTHPNYHRLKNRSEELRRLGAQAFNRVIPD